MALPDSYKGLNLEAVAVAAKLLQRGKDIGAHAARLSDNAWAIFFSRSQLTERRRMLQAAADLRADVGAIDLEIVDYWRVSPTPTDPIDPNWFRIQMSTRAIVRDTVLRYVNEAVQTVHDNQLRAIARATMWVSIFVLLVAGATLLATLPWWKHDDPARASYDAQASCGRSAAEWFKLLYLDNGQRDFPQNVYQNHYNVRLNRCLAQVASSPIEDAKSFPWVHRSTVFDVTENRELGRFIWSIEPRKLPTVMRCEFNGTGCHSAEEWNASVKSYMGW
jgi:hypothetical protein